MNLHGWDTAFLVREDRINALLERKRDTVIQTFSVTLEGSPKRTAEGKLDAWRLTDGSSGEIIHLRLPIQEGTLTSDSAKIDLAGLALVVATRLRWLDQVAGGSLKDLKFDYNRLAEPGNPPQEGQLSVVALLDPSGKLSSEENALLAFALGKALVTNADKVRFVFAQANLVPPATNSWLTPKKSAYGYVKRQSDAMGYLAILSVTDGRDITNLQRNVDPAGFPNNANSAFLISDRLFLLNSVATALARAFNAPIEIFIFDEKSRTLKTTARVYSQQIKVGLIWYTPEITTLGIQSGDGYLDGQYSGSVDMKAGIMMYYSIHAKNAGQYDRASGTLIFHPDPKPVTSHKAKVPWWWYLTGIITVAIVEVVVSIISSDLAKKVTDDNRERLAFGKNPPTSIILGDGSGIVVTDINVAGGIRLQGNV